MDETEIDPGIMSDEQLERAVEFLEKRLEESIASYYGGPVDSRLVGDDHFKTWDVMHECRKILKARRNA